MATRLRNISAWLQSEVSIAPLALFRFLLGVLLVWGMLRFWYYGWIERFYIEPDFHFSYWGLAWAKPWGDYTYLLFLICALSSLGMALGLWYRFTSSLSFLSFTYIELMDKTSYLNHYYFVAILLFLMIFLPAAQAFSLDAWRRKKENYRVERWHYFFLWAMISLLYWYAGLAKLNSDWLLEAQPLKIWLAGRTGLPLIGPFLEWPYAAHVFSWAGAAYDLCIPFLLWHPRSRYWALILVVGFHVLTRILFPIGIFPYAMIFAAMLFFNGNKLEAFFKGLFRIKEKDSARGLVRLPSGTKVLFGLILIWQLLWPWRYQAYPGELFWHEQGFRFSWRVMLMEKAGYAQFEVRVPSSGLRFKVQNHEFLSPFQEKQMSFQPDFILEYAHHLAAHYVKELKVSEVEVYVDSYVALNGRPSQVFVRPDVNLIEHHNSFQAYQFLMPFNDTIRGI